MGQLYRIDFAKGRLVQDLPAQKPHAPPPPPEPSPIAPYASRVIPAGQKHALAVGDVLVASWGYEQTNVDFYRVVAVLPASVRLVQALTVLVEDRGSYVHVVPGASVGEPVTKRVSARGEVGFSSYKHGYLWDGKPQHQTGWGYGH